MQIKLQNPQRISLSGEKVFFLPFFSGDKVKTSNRQLKEELEKIFAASAPLEEGETRLAFSSKGRFIFLNLGEKAKWNQRKFLLSLRKVIRFLKENKVKDIVLVLNEIIPPNADLASLSRQTAENIILANYEFNRYKKEPKHGWFKIHSVEISWPDSQRYKKDMLQGEIIGKAANLARDLSNTPGGEMTPDKLAKEAVSIARKLKNVKVTVFEEKRLKKMRMNGILGVSQGSSLKPRLIVLKYSGRRKDEKTDLVFVGKGVTFDTGGINLKPSGSGMQEMNMDMSGGAAVLGAVTVISKLNLPLNIVSLIPAVENMPSGHALRPGDVLKMYNGKTVEVANTDAEGRIILADALSYAAKNFKPRIMVDLATLTESALVALGQDLICLISNSEKLESVLRQTGDDSGDYVWPLPLWDGYEGEIKGNIADVSNTGKAKYGGAITAALFLNNFTEALPWVHLDIAPTMSSTDNQGLAKGATGTGVRYLVELARNFQKIQSQLK